MGTQKGGTTALHSFLSRHPDICCSVPKEVHFFDKEDLFKENDYYTKNLPYPEYHKHFSHWRGEKILLDTTPIYMYWEPVYQRIYQYNKKVKLIFILRDPSERAFSQWKMEYIRGEEDLDFKEALRLENDRLASGKEYEMRHHSYIDRGYYFRQISALLDLFPIENFLILLREELLNCHQQFLDRICDFLSIPCFKEYPESQRILPDICEKNMIPTDYLDEEYRVSILKKFENDISQLSDLTGKNFDKWLD